MGYSHLKESDFQTSASVPGGQPGHCQPGHWLGPATVRAAEGALLTVAVPDQGERSARLAMALAYDAEPGDIVLVIGQEDRWYIIGVIDGGGRTRLVGRGDVEVTSLEGSITFNAATTIEVNATAFELVCEAASVTARSLREHFVRAGRWVGELFELRCGQMTTEVDEIHQTRAAHIVAIAQEQVKIDGEQINLG